MRRSELATVLALFEQQVTEGPNRLAVEFEKRQLTFDELNELSNQFANALKAAGVSKGGVVGLCVDRTPEAIAAMFGAFKVGAAFVPLDPDYPIDRIQYMLDDAAIAVVIISHRESNSLFQRLEQDAVKRETTWIEFEESSFTNQSKRFERVDLRGNDLAYVMYTSGSTGRPKGVEIEHAALTAYCLADIEAYGLQSSDRTLQFSTLNFDIAIEEIFPPLLIGSAVVVRPSQRAEATNELSQIIEDYAVTAVHLATAYWHEWVDLMLASSDRVPSSMRLVIVTGEKVSVEHYRRWLKLCHHQMYWFNAYGPTETTVTATVYSPAADFSMAQMPIGKPLPGYTAFILDDHLELVDGSETGHLFIGGDALARGYLNRPELTQAAFIDWNHEQHGSHRLYRTGDLARWLPCGNIEFSGRVDHQIKLGSYRIEPGEIESVLNKHPDIRESLIVYEEVACQKYLVAYLATGEKTPILKNLVQYLQTELPSYMVPARYVVLDKLPKTVNGKIDRRALPDPSVSQVVDRSASAAPQSPMEIQLAEAFKQALHLPEIGLYDDFFALGGSSLLVTKVIAMLKRELNIDLPVRDFFANPTVAAAARHIEYLLQPKAVAAAEESPNQAIIASTRQPVIYADFFARGDRQLFCVRYEPRANNPAFAARRGHGVLICHPLGQEYTRSHRNLQQLANQLCLAGFDVLRFDYYGTGNSHGESQVIRTESLIADIKRAAQFFREACHCARMSALGLRLGATLLAAADLDGLDRTVLWDPVVSGAQYLNMIDRFHDRILTNQSRFPFPVERTQRDQAYGYEMHSEQRSSLGHLQLPRLNSKIATLVLLSNKYRDFEPGITGYLDRVEVVDTQDELYWHRPEYCESAFSSPGAFDAVIPFMCGGRR
ncbi:MAG: amino acid adenylation domain-containing protein [Planctomycetales bacterium]|nr:amino acid adenylation domain-containing protein [Planctomycetales bacterium]